MKKYFVGISAVILAICFSAFNTVQSPDGKRANGFWYNYTPSTNKVSLLPDGNVSITETRAVQVTGCDVPTTAHECARLYSSQLTGTFPKTAPASGIVESLFIQP